METVKRCIVAIRALIAVILILAFFMLLYGCKSYDMAVYKVYVDKEAKSQIAIGNGQNATPMFQKDLRLAGKENSGGASGNPSASKTNDQSNMTNSVVANGVNLGVNGNGTRTAATDVSNAMQQLEELKNATTGLNPTKARENSTATGSQTQSPDVQDNDSVSASPSVPVAPGGVAVSKPVQPVNTSGEQPVTAPSNTGNQPEKKITTPEDDKRKAAEAIGELPDKNDDKTE